jgi:hypothetical protein
MIFYIIFVGGSSVTGKQNEKGKREFCLSILLGSAYSEPVEDKLY